MVLSRSGWWSGGRASAGLGAHRRRGRAVGCRRGWRARHRAARCGRVLPVRPAQHDPDADLDRGRQRIGHVQVGDRRRVRRAGLVVALAVALLDARGFRAEDFARSHPGGSLGRRLLTHVSDVMRSGDAVPSVLPTASFSDLMREMSAKGLGASAVVDANKKVFGILTDGDLRRLLEKTTNLDGIKLESATTADPRTIPAELLAEEAIEMMEKHRINHLVVTDDKGHLLGALNLHDLFAAKVI